jgi:hypothetical protein
MRLYIFTDIISILKNSPFVLTFQLYYNYLLKYSFIFLLNHMHTQTYITIIDTCHFHNKSKISLHIKVYNNVSY